MRNFPDPNPTPNVKAKALNVNALSHNPPLSTPNVQAKALADAEMFLKGDSATVVDPSPGGGPIATWPVLVP